MACRIQSERFSPYCWHRAFTFWISSLGILKPTKMVCSRSGAAVADFFMGGTVGWPEWDVKHCFILIYIWRTSRVASP